MKYQHIITIQDDAANDLIARVEREKDFVYRGANEKSIRKAVKYLSQWDSDMLASGLVDELDYGDGTKQAECGEYVLSWHTHYGVASLHRIVEDVIDGVVVSSHRIQG